MDGDDLDALCALMDGPVVGAGDAGQDVDDLLGCLATPAESTGAAKGSGSRGHGRVRSLATVPEGSLLPSGGALPELEDELPLDLALSLPDDVAPVPFAVVAKFKLRCEVDVKKVAFGVRSAEFNPRKHSCVTVRLVNPRATALVRTSGVCSISGAISSQADLDTMRFSAKKVARLVQRCGQDEVRFAEYSVSSLLCKVTLHFPVDLRRLAVEYRRFAVYEPETYCGCVFKMAKPKWTYLITAGGRVMISGVRKLEEAWDALRRIYPVLLDFQSSTHECLKNS